MKNIKLFVLPLLASSVIAQQNIVTQPQTAAQNANPPVYPANAGAAVQQNIFQAQPQSGQQAGIVQWKDFGASVFYHERNTLVKRDLSVDSLKKAAVIFFGDWCPNCHKFITDSAQYLAQLHKSGINVILIHIPSADKLQNWQDPTPHEYESIKQKVASFGIKTSNVQIVLLGERTVLSRLGITGLPVFIAVKDSKEFHREIGTTGAAQLKNEAIRTQLMNVWKAGKENKAKSSKSGKKSTQMSQTKASQGKSERKSESNPKLNKEQMIRAKTATAMLNDNWAGGYSGPDLNAIGLKWNGSKKDLNAL